MLFAAATSGQPAEGEQTVPQPHPGVSSQLQEVRSVDGKEVLVFFLMQYRKKLNTRMNRIFTLIQVTKFKEKIVGTVRPTVIH